MGILKWINNIGGNTLYFPGCLTKYVLKNEFENYKKILNLLDIKFLIIEDLVCCGAVALNAGYRKDARKLAMKNFELLKKEKIKKIITDCSSCYNMFKEVYPSLIVGWDIEVDHIVVEILKGLKKNGINFNGESNSVEEVVYNDCCNTNCKIYDEAREVINRLGGKIIEMKTIREESIGCGAGGGVINNFPVLAQSMAKRRLEESPNTEKRIISSSTLCHYNLKSVTEKSIDISTFLLERLSAIPK